jgi:anti-anti-sigma factor
VEGFSIRTSHDGLRSRIAAGGEIDLAVTDRLWEELDLHVTPGRVVVLDCAGVAFIDSMGLRVLIKAAQKAAEVGAEFQLREPTPAVRRVLDLSGVSEVFGIGVGGDVPV